MSSGLLSTVRDLARRRARRRRNLTVAEGVRLVEELLAVKASIRGTITSPMLETSDRGRALKAGLARIETTHQAVSDFELVDLAATEHPQGVIVLVEPPTWHLADMRIVPGRPLLVVDGVQDPGNVGALCRTAHGLGAAGVVALPGTAELFSPKALRGSMGALWRLPALRCDDQELVAWLQGHQVELWLSDAAGEPLGGPRSDRAVALVVGNEGSGAGALLREHAVRAVGIPLVATAESLNVAVAAGILLYEVVHGR